MLAQDRASIFELGECRIDLHRRELRMHGVAVPIGGRAFEIIETLVRSFGTLVTKDELMREVWRGSIVEENTLQVHISAVRKALGPLRGMLKTESGRGYRLLGQWSARQNAHPAIAAAIRPAVPPVARQTTAATVEFETNLPAAPGPLIGREEAVQQLLRLLSAYRLVTLTGPAGIGKTSLALHAANSFLAEFEGGACLVELASLSNAEWVSSAIANALGLRLGGDRISAETVARGIGGGRLILLLDNCEHVIGAAASAAETIVRLCPSVTVLATSREVLRAEGEYVYRVPTLTVPSRDGEEAEDLLSHSAVELFVTRTRALDAEFAADAESLAMTASICRNLDGIPLAIEFAAARAATLGLGEVAAHLDDRFRFLTAGRRTALPRHQTLRAALDWSYELLPEAEQRLLRRLAIFRGDFPLDAAVAVAGDGSPTGLRDDLTNLVVKSLVVADLNAAAARYRLLDTIRLYALEKLRDGGEYREVAFHHARHYVDFFALAAAESETRAQDEWRGIYGPHLANVRAALDWTFSLDGNEQLGVALTVAAIPLWVQLSLLDECRERAERALSSLGEDEADSRARMQLSAALAWSLMYGVGRAREARPAWARTLELADRLGDVEHMRRALWGLCIDQFNNGNFRAALDFAERYAGIVADSNDPIDRMMGDRILATSWHYLGDQNEARRHIDRVVTRLNSMTEQSQIVRLGFEHRLSAHYFQARILWLQGFADQAMQIVESNIAEGQAVGQALTFCSVLGQGACPIAFLAGDFDTAARYGTMLLDHTERHPVRLWHLWARCFNAMVRARRGDSDGCEVLRKELDDAGDARFLPRFLLPLGELAAALGRAGEVAQGLATIDETLERCKTRNEGWYVPELMRIRGELLLQRSWQQSSSEAEDCLRNALSAAHEQGMLFWELRVALSLAQLWASRDRRADARPTLQPVFDRFTEGFGIADLRSARDFLATL